MLSKLLKILIIALIFIGGAGLSAYLTLTLIVKSEKTVVVPALKDKEVVYALQILSDMGLNTRIKSSRYSNAVLRNHVIAQEPLSGTEIKKGRTVRLVISRGQRSISTPALSGLSLDQALVVLEEKGLCAGVRSRSKHATLQAGMIIAQSPPAGIIIRRDKCVDLLISTGPHRDVFAMIELTTLPLEEAILRIETGGLKLGSITPAASQEVPLDTVARQTPPAGYPIEPGQTVQLGVNRTLTGSGPAPAATRPRTWFLRHHTGAGLLNTHVKARINSTFISYDLFNDFMSPGAELFFLIPRFENVTVMLYEDGELKRTVYPGSAPAESSRFGWID